VGRWRKVPGKPLATCDTSPAFIVVGLAGGKAHLPYEENEVEASCLLLAEQSLKLDQELPWPDMVCTCVVFDLDWDLGPVSWSLEG
jgi:hypothetical protein